MTAEALRQQEWRWEAECLDRLDVDFDPDPPGERRTPTVEQEIVPLLLCRNCPVKSACLSDALAQPEHLDHGIRGGTTKRDRGRIRERRRQSR